MSDPECRVCGEPIPPREPGRPGRPRIYCSDRCHWRAGHIAAAEATRQVMAERDKMTYEELLDWVEHQTFRELG